MTGIDNNYVKNRADFFRVLGEAQQKTGELMKVYPKSPTLDSIEIQLDAMWRWTVDDRTPTLDERKSITIGKVVNREMEPAATDELYVYMQKLYELSAYFKDWMTDEEMENFDDSDPMSDFGEAD